MRIDSKDFIILSSVISAPVVAVHATRMHILAHVYASVRQYTVVNLKFEPF